MEKVKVTQAQAEAIRIAVADYGSDNVMNDHSPGNWGSVLEPLNDLTPHQLARALYVGYEAELEYKVGDWVVHKGDRIRIGVIKDFYGQGKMVITDILSRDGIEQHFHIDAIRHATPDEIEQEKERRWWSRHGREVWELRKDDIISQSYPTLVNDFKVCMVNDDHVYCNGYFKANDVSRKIHMKDIKDSFKVVCFAEDRKDQ